MPFGSPRQEAFTREILREELISALAVHQDQLVEQLTSLVRNSSGPGAFGAPSFVSDISQHKAHDSSDDAPEDRQVPYLMSPMSTNTNLAIAAPTPTHMAPHPWRRRGPTIHVPRGRGMSGIHSKGNSSNFDIVRSHSALGNSGTMRFSGESVASRRDKHVSSIIARRTSGASHIPSVATSFFRPSVVSAAESWGESRNSAASQVFGPGHSEPRGSELQDRPFHIPPLSLATVMPSSGVHRASGDTDIAEEEGIGAIKELTDLTSSQPASPYFDLDTERTERLETEREIRVPLVKTHHQTVIMTTNEVVADFVRSSWFEQIAGTFVILNALTLGCETSYQAANRSQDILPIFSVFEVFFCVIFTAELVLRLNVYGSHFFTMEDWPWNVFDLTVVTLQVVETVAAMLRAAQLCPKSVVSAMRILRLIRITRIIRVLRLVEQLRTLVSCIMGSMKSLAWTLCLLVMSIYFFSVLFTQIVLDVLHEETINDPEQLEQWFGGLGRTSLTLYESIVGGVSWDEAVRPLIQEVSVATGVLFCGYIALCVFALMNVVTGVFVEEATRMTQESSDMHLAKYISALFMQDAGAEDSITVEKFEEKIVDEDMKEYFKSINIDPSEAQGLFQLLDVDGSGDVDCVEIVNGLLRLRGNAKALELSLLMSEICRLHQRLDNQEYEQQMQRSRSPPGSPPSHFSKSPEQGNGRNNIMN